MFLVTLAEWRIILNPLSSLCLTLRAFFLIFFARYTRKSEDSNSTEEPSQVIQLSKIVLPYGLKLHVYA